MRQGLHIGLLVLGAALTLALGRSIPRRFSEGLPQVAGEDVLALVLGDARQLVSLAMLDKAEEYFHGGARIVACDHQLHGEGEAHEERAHEAHGQEGHACSAACSGHDAAAAKSGAGQRADPWAWLNSRIHAQEHRHAEGKAAEELLPWLWAACRSSPQNVQAYENAAYVLARMTGRPAEAVSVLEEGISKNPGSASLEFSLGELALRELRDPARARRAFEAAREKCRPASGADGQDDRVLKVRTLFFLGFLAKQRGDLARAREYLAEAEALLPEHVSTKDLQKLLKPE